jgi:hypothetical protein
MRTLANEPNPALYSPNSPNLLGWPSFRLVALTGPGESGIWAFSFG